MNFGRTIYSGHAVLRFHGAYDARLHDVSFCRSPIYHIALSDSLRNPRPPRLISNILSNIIYTDSVYRSKLEGSLIRRRYSARAADGTRKRDAGTPDIN